MAVATERSCLWILFFGWWRRSNSNVTVKFHFHWGLLHGFSIRVGILQTWFPFVWVFPWNLWSSRANLYWVGRYLVKLASP